ncbi:molybdopterin-dependent oxidoreductase [Reyranella sp.]|uniref:molybdopterin-dependent oxidoreductase n=1 Tax=Reyranella sp. TaxID=1929291 RepID=UPI003D1028AE
MRYHLANIPFGDIDPDTWTVEVKGKVNKPLKLKLAELNRMPSFELVAANQCSGNSRGFSNPRVAGGPSGNGAMGIPTRPASCVQTFGVIRRRRLQVSIHVLSQRARDRVRAPARGQPADAREAPAAASLPMPPATTTASKALRARSVRTASMLP